MQKKLSTTQILLIIVSVLAVLAIVGLSIPLGIITRHNKGAQSQITNIYEKSYYETIDCLSSIETNLAKVDVVTGTKLKQAMLNDIWRECDIACSNISQLSTQSAELEKLIRFLNQMGDYCYYISRRLPTEPMKDSDKKNINTFFSLTQEINKEFAEIQTQVVNGKLGESFITKLDALSTGIVKINYSTVDYPELIYDGPFSDALLDREVKFLTDVTEIDEATARKMLTEQYKDSSNIVYLGEGKGTIPTYMYEFDYQGTKSYAQLSVKGGYTVMFDSYCEVSEPNISEDEGEALAYKYIKALGYENMKAVWTCNNNSTFYYNFVHYKDDIAYYPDMIKIKVCAKDGNLLGVEAQNYIYNHTTRTLPPKSDEKVNVSPEITVVSKSYCLIPTPWNSELLCQEIVGTKGDHTFYLYYNITNGEEEKVLMVIDEEGRRLI